MTSLLWFLPTLLLLPGVWFAAAWWYGRPLRALQQQLLAERQAAHERAQTARWQIGQLQAELAARPPLPPTPPPPGAADTTPAARRPRASDDFPATAILADGFAPTVLLQRGQ